MQARVEYESHHFGAARDLASVLTKIEPGKSRGFALLGDALLEFGDLDQAAAAYDEMRKRKGDPVETETRLARLELMRGAHDSARMHFEKALEVARDLSPASPEIVAWCLVQLGQLAFNTGQWDAAEKNFQAALAERPDDFAVLEHLGELRAAQEKYDESISLYGKVIARTPRPEFQQALGDRLAAEGFLLDHFQVLGHDLPALGRSAQDIGQTMFERLAAEGDAGQGIVDLVGNAGGQEAHAG